MQIFFGQVGSSVAPLFAGIIADSSSLKDAILIICVSAWAACFIFICIAAYLVPKDLQDLRDQLKQRAEIERARA